jgi:hypothetical protein
MTIYNYSDITPELIMNTYLYGAPTKPASLADQSIVRPSGDLQSIVFVNAGSFMTDGPGRFVNASMSTLVQNFFSSNSLMFAADGQRHEYSLSAIKAYVSGDEKISIQQYNYDDQRGDYGQRTFIWGSSSFTLAPDVKFVVDETGKRSIENLSIRPFDDNFDFESANLVTSLAEGALINWMDPSNIGRTVQLNFAYMGSIPVTPSYSASDLQLDQQVTASYTTVNPVAIRSYVSDLADHLWDPNIGITRYLDSANRPIVYGTTGSEQLNQSLALGDLGSPYSTYLSPYVPNGIVYVAGPGDDILIDTNGADVMLGGLGQDTADFSGGGSLSLTMDSGVYSDTSTPTPVTTIQIDGRNGPDLLAGIEKMLLSSGADTVKVAATADMAVDLTIDAGTQAPNSQDVLDLAQSNESPTLDGDVHIDKMTFRNFEKLVLSDGANTFKVVSGAPLGGLKEVDAAGNPANDPDVVDFSQSNQSVRFSNNTLTDKWATLKIVNFEKIVGSATADVINLDKGTMIAADGAGGNDTLIGGSVMSTLIGGDGTDQLFAGSGGAILDGGVSNGEGDRYVGGKGADTFVIGNGVHANQGTDAAFIIDNAGANDRIVLRLSDTVGTSDASSLTKGIVLNGGVQSLIWTNDGVFLTPHPADPNHVTAVLSSVLVNVAGVTDTTNNSYPSAEISGRTLEYARPEAGVFTAYYDWNKSASTLDIKITTAYGDFSVHVNNFQNGQLGLNFVTANEPLQGLTLFHGDAAGPLLSSWTNYHNAALSLLQSAQIIDLPSTGTPAAGSAAPTAPTLADPNAAPGYIPAYNSSFNPEEGAAFGSFAGAGGTPSHDDPNAPKRAPFRDKNPNPLVKHDPLVFDLSGNGLHLTDVDLSSAYVDYGGDGFAVRSGWTDLSEAVLIDYDGTNNVGAGTILGAASGDGFADLASFDTDGNGVVDANDGAATALRFWVDRNGDGAINTGELMTFSEAGIQSLNVQGTVADQTIGGNNVGQSGTFLRTDGTVGDFYDVAFVVDPVLTKVEIPAGYTYSPQALLLPALAGYGHVADFQYAMSENSNLRSEALQLVLDSGGMTGSEFDVGFEHLLQSWAGAGAVDPTSRGPLIDARHLTVVEAFYGQTFAQVNGVGATLDADTAAAIDAAYYDILDAMKIRFIEELPVSALANGVSTGDIIGNPLSLLALAAQYNPADDAISVNLNGFVASVATAAPTTGRQQYFDRIARVAEALRVDLAGGDKSTLRSNIASALSATNLGAGWQNQVLAEVSADHIVDALAQGNTVVGSEGNDAILASATNQTLSGGGGADVYIYSSADGNIVIDDSSAQSGLLLSDIAASDVSASRSGDNVVLTVGSTGKTITMVNQPGGVAIQSVTFGDGTVLSNWQLAALVNPPNEYIGTDGADELDFPGYSGETYVLGGGDDVLLDSGVNGETFVYRAGDGNDFYNVSGTTPSTNNLSLIDIDPTGVSLARDGNNITITILATNETIRIWSQISDANSGIAQITFADGTVWDRNTINETATTSTPGYEVVLGNGDQTAFGDGKPHRYVYSSSGGNDVIEDFGGEAKLVYSDIASADVSFSRNGGSNDLVITDIATGKKVTVIDEFGLATQFNGFSSGAMQSIAFSDGVVKSQSQLEQLEQMFLDQGTAASGGSIYGFDGDDTIVAGLGDKYLNGESGANTYIYSSAGGNDIVDDQGQGASVVFSDIASTGMSLARLNGSNDLIFTNTATGKTVTVKNEFAPFNAPQTFQFSDGVSLSHVQVEQMLLDQASAANGSSIYGYSDANDTIIAGVGDKYLNGEGGVDTYVYSSAGGNDRVDDGGLAGTLVFSDIASTDVRFSQDGTSLVITGLLTGKTVTVLGEFSPFRGGRLQTIRFSDGVSLTPGDVQKILIDQESAADGGAVYGFDYSDDTIAAGLGDKYLYGGVGDSDTYIYTPAGGNTTIDDDSGTLVMRDIASTGVTLSNPSNSYDVILTVMSTGKTVTLKNELTPWYSGLTVNFSDGVSWNRSQISNLFHSPPTVTISSAAEASTVATQTITGTVTSGGAAIVAGQTVTLTDNGTTIGTATVQANGSFSAAVTLANQGANSIVATVTDSLGNTGSSTAVVDTLDTLDNVAPMVTISSAAEASNAASQTITGTVISGGAAIVVGQTVTLTDNGTTIGTATVQANGSFSAAVTLSDQGANSIVATVTDSFGNTVSSTAVVDTLDNIAPTVSITSAAEASNVASQTITGTVTSGGAAVVAGQTVTLTDNGTVIGTATVQANGSFSASVTLANQGTNSIVATVTDSFGNTGSSTAVVDTLDNIAPTVTISSAAEASNVATQTITGTVTSGGAAIVAGQTVTLTDNGTTIGTATVQADGSFSTNVALVSQGSNSIVAIVTDSFGNTGSSTAVVDTLDNIAPTVTITSAAEASNVATQTITGTVISGGAAVVAGQTVTLTDNGTTVGTTTVQADGSFSASVTLANQGANSIMATVTDSFGNTGSSTAVVDTLDNIAPTVTITSAAEASNVASQTITGTVTSGGAAIVAGQTVTLTDNGTTVGTATVQADGSFSAAVTLASQGSNSIVATVIDSFGNTGSSAAVVDTLDNIAPTVTISSAAEAGNVATQTITGTVTSGGAAVVAGQTVTLTDNGTTVGTATVQADGSFSASVTLANQGTNSIVAIVTDSFGNTGSSAAVVDTLDNIAPTVTITGAAEASNVATQTITGTVTSGGAAIVAGQTVTLTDNGTTVGTATVQANGSFSASVTLANQGSNSIVATVTDSYGNTGSSTAVVDTLDNIAPTVTITSAAEASSVASQTITGTVTSGGAAIVAGQTVTLTDNGTTVGTATVQADGSFSAAVTLANQGSNSIVATVTDSFGNTGSSAAVVDTLDNIAPTVTITSAAEAGNVASQTITGAVSSGGAAAVAGQTVTLTDNGTTIGTATVQANGSFSASVTLANQGSNSIVATVTDSFGNTGSSTAVVDTLDNIAPTVTITSAAEASKNAGQTITGTVISGGAAVVAGQTVTLTDNGTTIGTATVQANGSFSAAVTLPNQGSNSIVATVTDSYGNTGSSTAVVDTLDNIAPTVTITSAAEAGTNASQTITGMVTSGGVATIVGQTVTLTDNGTTLGTATVQANGSFSAAVTLANQGSNSIVATVTDSYGNTGSSSAVVDILDSIAPTVTITSAAEASKNASQTISGTVTSGYMPAVVGQTVTLTDNGTMLGTATIQANGSFSAAVTLPNQGPNSIVATVTDSFGNTGSSTAVVDTLDNIAPTVTITSAAEVSSVAAQTITGTVTSGGAAAVVGQTVTLTDNGTTLGTATVQSNGTFSKNVTLPNQGFNSIVATVTDSFGNVGSSTGVVDTLASTTNVSNTTISLANGSALIVTGNNDTVVVNAGLVELNDPSGSITVNGASDSVLIVSSNSSGTINGNSDTISVTGNSDSVFINGSNNSVALTGTAESATFAGTDTVSANNATLNLSSGALTVSGSSDTINLNSVGETLSLSGTGSVDNITIALATQSIADVINASGDNLTINVPASSGQSGSPRFGNVTVNGSGDTLSVNSGSSFDSTNIQLNGNNNFLGAGGAGTTNITVTGTGNTVSTTGSNINLSTANSSAIVQGNNNTITLSTGDTLSITSGTGENISGNGASIIMAANTSATINGTDTVSASNATLTLSGGALTVGGSGDAINLNSVGETLSLSGTGATANVTVVEATTAAGATPEVINASGDNITLNVPASSGSSGSARFSSVTVNGNGDTLSLNAGSFSSTTLQINGNNNALSFNNTNNTFTILTTITGTGNVVAGSNAAITLAASSSASITGNGDNITIASGDSLTISGTNDTVSGSGAAVNVAASSAVTFTGTDTVSANNATLNLSSGALTVSGSSDTINLNSVGETLSLSGTGSADNITIALATASIADVINASGDNLTINVPASSGQSGSPRFGAVTVNGNSDTLSVNSGSSFDSTNIRLNGNNNFLGAGGAGTTNISITGTGNTVSTTGSNIDFSIANSSATVQGNNNTVTLSTGDTLSITSGTGESISGNGASIIMAASTSATISSSNDDITATGNSTITLGGSGDIFQAASGVSSRISATSGSVNVNDIETIVFGNTTNSVTLANGSGTITIVGVASVTSAIAGTTGNNALTGTTGNDIFDGKGGLDSEQGNGGDDTYAFRKGYGQLTINNFSSANNNSLGTLSFDSSVAASNVTIARGGVNFGDLILSIPSTGDQVTVSGAFSAGTNGLRQVLFADGTRWDMNFLAAHAGYNVNVNGSSSTINASNAAFINVAANSATVTVNGSSDWVTVTGTGDSVVVSGSNDTVTTINATAVTVAGTGSSASISGNGNSVNVTGASDSVALVGTGDSLVVTGSSATVTTTSAAAITVAGSSSSAAIGGNSNAVSITGASDQVTLNGNSDAVTIGGSSDTIVANGANETYFASSGSGQVTINNATASGSTAQGQLDFSSGITNENLWFVQSGNNLNIDILGTHDQFTIANWFGANPAASLAEIVAGDGLKLDSAVSQLVQAMATYSANNPGFLPAMVSQAPADSNLQTAIAAAWHQ